MVRIQYASDLHINDWPDQTNYENFIIPVAPVLIVAGDVCSALDKSSRTVQVIFCQAPISALLVQRYGRPLIL